MPVPPGTEVGSFSEELRFLDDAAQWLKTESPYAFHFPCVTRLSSIIMECGSKSKPAMSTSLNSRLCIDAVALLWSVFYHQGNSQSLCMFVTKSECSFLLGTLRALEGFADTKGISHFSSIEEHQSFTAAHRRGFDGTDLTMNL